MPLSSNPARYLDVDALLRESIRSGGGTLRFASQAGAATWLHRANKYRTLCPAPSPFDTLVLRRRGEEIQIDLNSPQGIFTPHSQAQALAEVSPGLGPDEDLLSRALKLMKDPE